jgi:hypothetical protein
LVDIEIPLFGILEPSWFRRGINLEIRTPRITPVSGMFGFGLAEKLLYEATSAIV